MRCLTPPSALGGSSGFLAANLYARSNFGEDALVNVSIERRQADGKIIGYIRIRSKTGSRSRSVTRSRSSRRVPTERGFALRSAAQAYRLAVGVAVTLGTRAVKCSGPAGIQSASRALKHARTGGCWVP
ncbi:coatomer beta subunit appendage platform-domain-containing protein [Pavlovales sp. CCMP2436]|nr:coatomer beta subunit appendage platform-domain-containing protein [Pavlovales sp. CCMP2436]